MSNKIEKNTQNKRFLGIDWGSKKVGLAVGDGETRMAFSYGVIENGPDFWKFLAEIIEKESVSGAVIGIPSRINRKETVYEGEILGEELNKMFPALEIFYQNEMFSTKIAQDRLREKGVRSVGKKDDPEAARIILESWMEKNLPG